MVLRFRSLLLLLLVVHCLVCVSKAAHNAVETPENLRLADNNNNNNVFEVHRRMAEQCTIDGIGACNFQENGEYYQDCGESDYFGADIIFKIKSDMWCFSKELDHDICCGDAVDCCDVKWWIAISIFVGCSLLFSLLCCGLCYFCQFGCFSSKRREKKATPAPAATDDDSI